jgi:hypothetical protein
MAELCVDFDGQEFCSSGEVLIAAIIIECLFYVFLFIGGWELIRRWRMKRERQRQMKARLKAEKWIPYKK